MSEPLRPSLLALLAAAIGGGTAAVYLFLISDEGESVMDVAVLSVFGGIAACAVMAFLGGLARDPRRRYGLLIGATIGLFLFGLIGIFSIGFPLLIGAAFTLAEVLRLRPMVGKGVLSQAEARRQAVRRERKKPF